MKAALVAVLVLWTATLSAVARAGTVIVVETTSFVQASKSGTATLYLDKDRMRIDSTEGGGNYSVIYRLEKSGTAIYWVIDHAANTYVELSPEDLRAIKSRIEESREMLRRQMEQLPPHQRKVLEDTYRAELGTINLDGAPAEYKKIASGSKFKQWRCNHYEGYRGDEKQEDVWAATWQSLGVEEAEVRVLAHLSDALQATGQDLPAFFQFGRDAASGEYGLEFPVMVLTYEAGRRKESSEVVDVRRESFGPQLFELPTGLTQRTPGQ